MASSGAVKISASSCKFVRIVDGRLQVWKIVQMAKFLIANGIQINQTDREGMNALMLLCESPRNAEIVKVAQFLIDKGIHINQTDCDGRNALMFLCGWSESEKILELTQLFIANGIKISQTDWNGEDSVSLLVANQFVPISKKIFVLLILLWLLYY